jgi:dTDP-4-amino-4,6-dideoxygalactose transaminase
MVAEFEAKFARRHQVKYAFAVNSCTSALHLSALALGLKEGDEALVPSFTWVTSANCIEYTGAKAVFVDVSPNTFNIDPVAMERAITSRTKAVVVVHLFGLSAEMDTIIALAHKHNLKIIEDCACGFGTSYDSRPVGGLGDIGCFSFHPRKVITTGEGGMITTNNPEYAEITNSLRNHGCAPHLAKPGPVSMSHPYTMSRITRLGYNFRMPDILGAVGLAQLVKGDYLVKERIALAEQYNRLLVDVDEVIIPSIPEKCSHTYQSYVIRLSSQDVGERNRLMDAMAEQGIATRPGTHAAHRLELYQKKYQIKPQDLPMSTLCEDTSITLPLFHGMEKTDQTRVAEAIRKNLHQL